jgi:hypothetical protein
MELPGFDDIGNLHPGCYKPSANEFKTRFVDDFNTSSTRVEIFEGYQQYCDRVVNTGVAIKQWANGSFTTDKEDPGDIDLFNLFDGLAMNDTKIIDEVLDLLDEDPIKTQYHCHSFGVSKYPEEMTELYSHYRKRLNHFLRLWRTDKKDNSREKGVIEFGVDILGDIGGL